jgi:hypothetical protein
MQEFGFNLEIPAPEAARCRGFLLFRGGVSVPPLSRPVPVTAAEAAARLDRSVGTVYSWVTRHGARRLKRVNRKMYYDLNDLRVIEREIRHGHPVPASPEDRAEIAVSCPLFDAERSFHAA